MQSKTSFFSVNSFNHSDFSLDNFDTVYRKIILSAHAKRFNSVADAKFYLALQGVDLDTMIRIFLAMEQMGMLTIPIKNALFSPVGCGDIANIFCKMMTGDAMICSKLNESQTITQLTNELECNLPKIIRIDVPGHSYIMLACEQSTEGILGYIYQSNVAYGMEDNSFSLAAWLMDAKSYKTNITHHLQKLNQLLNPYVPSQEKAIIYHELYFAQPIINVKAPANMEEIISYLNENIHFNYKVKEINAKNMFYMLKIIHSITAQYTEEEFNQSLDDYISKLKKEESINSNDTPTLSETDSPNTSRTYQKQ